jgi:tetratricopeptide (TPR) repeat protein
MSLQVIIFILLSIGGASYFVPTPQELRNQFVAGQNYFAAKNFAKAVEEYDKVLATKSDFLKEDSVRVTLLDGDLNVGVRTASMYQKANAFRNMGMNDSAIALFRLVQTRDDAPKLLALSQFQVYDIFFGEKQYDSVVTEARLLISRYPFDEKVEQAYYDIGWAFRLKGEYDSSSQTFHILTDNFKKSLLRVRALYQIGQNAMDTKRWQSALAEFKTLLAEYKPESFSKTDFQNMELLANRERQIFEAASNRESDNTNLELASKAEFKIAEAFEQLNQYDSAMTRYRYIIRTYTLLPSLIEISYIKMAELTLRVKGLKDAVAIYRKAIDDNFQNKVFQARMQYKIARTYQDNSAYDKAAAEYQFYVKAYGEFADAADFSVENGRFFAVLNYYAAKDYPNVIASTDSFLTYHPGSEFSAKALVMRGTAFQNLKKFAEARQCYHDVFSHYPASEEAVQARSQLAKSFYDEKTYDQAIMAYQELLTSRPAKVDTNEAHYYLGMSFFFASKLDSALYSLALVNAASEYYPFAFARSVKIYVAQRKYEEGEKYITGIISSKLTDSLGHAAYAHLAYGDLLAMWGKNESALSEMSSVLRDTSINENARLQAMYGRGILYQQAKQNKEAIADLEFCLKQEAFLKNFSSVVPSAHEKLALAYLGAGRKKDAVDKINRLLTSASSKSEKVRYLSALTEIYVQLNDFSRIVENATKVIHADSADDNSRAKAYVALANAYGNQNELDKVIATLNEAADTLPTHPYISDIIYQMAGMFYDAQAYDGAQKLFGKFLEKYQANEKAEDAFYFHAMSLILSGKSDQGIASLRSYIKKYSASSRAAEAQYQIAEAYYNSNRFESAIPEYERTAKEFPQSEFAVSALYNKGWCYYRSGDTLQMVETFKRFVAVYPKSTQAPDAQFSIGDYYYNTQQYEKAKDAYQVIVDQYPDYSRYEEAKGLVHELAQINSYKDYERAMQTFDAKNYSKAIQELEAVLKKYPDADVHFACEANIASAYSQLGEKAKALALFNGIITKYADTQAAQEVIFFAELHKQWIESGKQE